MARTINIKGLQLIEEFEGLDLKPYLDKKGVATIGIGTTFYEGGIKVKMGDPPISLERAQELLSYHLKTICTSLDKFITANNLKLGDNKFSALCCFAYNCGLSPIITPGKLIYDGLINGSDEKIREGFLAYNKITVIRNGKVQKIELLGLSRRRQAELRLFYS